MTKTVKSRTYKEIMFDSLNQMRETGIPSISATSHLITAFDVPPKRAAEVVKEWLKKRGSL